MLSLLFQETQLSPILKKGFDLIVIGSGRQDPSGSLGRRYWAPKAMVERHRFQLALIPQNEDRGDHLPIDIHDSRRVRRGMVLEGLL